MSKKLFTDSESCIWCWVCVAIAPEFFDFNKNWKAFTTNQPENKEQWDEVKNACDSCPVSVIHISND